MVVLWGFLSTLVQRIFFGLLVGLGWLLVPPRFHTLCPRKWICRAGYHFREPAEHSYHGSWRCRRCSTIGYDTVGY